MTSKMRSAAANVCAALAATLCVGMATSASAAVESAAGATAAKVPVEELEVLAEIRVRGRSLARSIEDAEDDFFKLYNKANTDEQYDVYCGHMSVDGSLIMKRACVPGFIADRAPRTTTSYPTVIYSGCGSSFRSGSHYDINSSCFSVPQIVFPANPPVVTVAAVAMHKREAYVDNVLKVINSDPQLVAKVRHIDSLYAEMLLTQDRLIKVRATNPQKADPRLRPR